MMKLQAPLFLLAFTLVTWGCGLQHSSSGGVSTALAAAPPASQPSKVLVAVFAAAPDIVQLDTSPGVRIQRSANGVSPQQAEVQDIAEVQSVLADTLVQKIQAMGLAAERVPAGTRPGKGQLLVTGQLNAIHEGNRARRTVVGFGAGGSSVQATATLLQGTADGPQVLQTFTLSATSGRMPGLGVGAAASGVKSAGTALSGGAHALEETQRSPVGDRAASLANHLSSSLDRYFTAQHWIPASR